MNIIEYPKITDLILLHSKRFEFAYIVLFRIQIAVHGYTHIAKLSTRLRLQNVSPDLKYDAETARELIIDKDLNTNRRCSKYI